MNQSTMSILMLVLIIVVMYFLLIRPQKKKEKAINEMRNAIKAGDEIVTIGGICGKIVKTKDESLVIQVGADKVKFEIMRWAVSKVVSESSAPAPAPATILRTTERRESIGGKIAELELRLREDKRTAIVEKILLKNTVKQQKHLRLSSWFPFLQRLIELLRSYGKSILHNNPARFSKVYATQHLKPARKIRL